MTYPQDRESLISIFLFSPLDQRDFLDAAESPAREPVNDKRPAPDRRKTDCLFRLGALERKIRGRKFRGEPVGARGDINRTQQKDREYQPER